METPRKFIIAITNLRGVSTKLNKYNYIDYFRIPHIQHCVVEKLTFFLKPLRGLLLTAVRIKAGAQNQTSQSEVTNQLLKTSTNKTGRK